MPWQPEPHEFDLNNGSPLGCGAVSVVHRMPHRRSGKQFAVKVVSKIQVTQQNKVEDIMAEKQALYALSPHPFTVTINATMQTKDELFFVLEHLPHGDLREHVVTHGPVSFKDCQTIIAQVIMGLDKVVTAGFVHRDLKPENLAFDANYRCKIIDFDTVSRKDEKPTSNNGEAVPKDPERKPGEKRRMTISQIQGVRKSTAAFCGTAQYVSPEMVGECKWSYASDLWALGCIAYYLLTGRNLFDGPGSYHVMKKIISGVKREQLGQDLSNHPASAADFIAELVVTDPTCRLGVDRRTGAFDVKQLRNHPFFEDRHDFWARLDTVVAKEAGVIPDPLDPVVEDPDRSFRSIYDRLPCHEQKYSDYVMTCPDGVFDNYLLGKVTGTDSSSQNSQSQGETHQDDQSGATNDQEDDRRSEQVSSSGSDSGDLEIIDDVGAAQVDFATRFGTEDGDVPQPFAFPERKGEH